MVRSQGVVVAISFVLTEIIVLGSYGKSVAWPVRVIISGSSWTAKINHPPATKTIGWGWLGASPYQSSVVVVS